MWVMDPILVPLSCKRGEGSVLYPVDSNILCKLCEDEFSFFFFFNSLLSAKILEVCHRSLTKDKIEPWKINFRHFEKIWNLKSLYGIFKIYIGTRIFPRLNLLNIDLIFIFEWKIEGWVSRWKTRKEKKIVILADTTT